MTKRFLLRLPDELYARLENLARAEGRSLNAEIVWLLGQDSINVISPDTHQADTTPPTDEQLGAALKADTGLPLTERDKAVLRGLGAEAFPPDKGKATLRPFPKPPCTCGLGERAKGKHNRHCPAR